MDNRQVIGIDFGTTNSSIAFLDIGSSEVPRLLAFDGTKFHAPTQLTLDPENDGVIGWGWNAETALRSRPEAEFKDSFKPSLGESEESKKLCYLYLTQLKEKICERKCAQQLTEDSFITAIGIPANWNEDQQELLRELAVSAGFPDVRIIPEPIAAMNNLRCQANRKFRFGDRPENYMIIDFGGGTLDICIVRTQELGRNPEKISTDGDPHLGGIVFDEIIEKQFFRQADIDPDKLKKVDRFNIRRQIQRAKKAISDTFKGENISAHYPISTREGDTVFRLDRKVFENICRAQDINKKISMAIERALQNAGLKPKDVRRVILTGGSSNWYFVKNIVAEKFGIGSEEEIFYTESPHTDVAYGLAIKEGRADEPPAKPGTWIKWKVDRKPWSEFKEIFSPDRVAIADEPQPHLLGVIKDSRLFRSRTIEIKWFHGATTSDAKAGEYSNLRLHLRSNHPKMDRLKRVIKAALDKPTEPREDKYTLYLIYSEDAFGQTNYSIDVQNNSDKHKTYKIVPGFDHKITWFGLGKGINEDNSSEKDVGENKAPKINNNLSEKKKSLFGKLHRRDTGNEQSCNKTPA
jgi:cell division ATPase FtsA